MYKKPGKVTKKQDNIYTKRIVVLLPLIICLAFFLAFSTLSIVKHNHFLTGYDLGVDDQVTWEFSQFKPPISTTHAYAFTSVFEDHIEFIYALVSPIYWMWNNVQALILLHCLAVAFSGLPLFLLARKKGIRLAVSVALLISYLMFYGVQNAIWADVHSIAFAVFFLSWFLYFLESERKILSVIFCFLALICKEDVGMLTFLTAFVYFVQHRSAKVAIVCMIISVCYVFAVFGIYYPHFTLGYRFQNQSGLLSHLSLSNLYNTPDKRAVLFYSLAWFGFIPLLSPLIMLIPLADVAHYFVLGSNYVTSAQGMFGHYRITLGVFMIWALIVVVLKHKWMNTRILACVLLACALVFQYILHLPLSYFAKRWFWTEPASVANIRQVLQKLPADASVVSQNNITPHIAHRTNIMTLWPDTKKFVSDSPCGKPECEWFHWADNPEYLVVDTSKDWDIRHFLANRERFVEGIQNLETAGVIVPYEKQGDATLYKVAKPY
jgi:uncharacterized membrane protein